MNDDQKNLRRALQQLPAHRPRPGAWEAVAQALADEEPLSRGLAQLPGHPPRADAWSRIAAELTADERRVIRPWHRYAAAVGAAILLSVAAFFVGRPATDDAVLTYSEELAPPPELAALTTDDPLEQEVQDYLQRLCQQAPASTCQQPEVVTLRAHLAELSEEERALQKTMEELGYDPQLVKYQVRIENMKAEATRELIQLVTS